jgi:integrase
MARLVRKRGHRFEARVRRGGITETRQFSTSAEARRWAEAQVGLISGDAYQDNERTPKKKGARTEKNRIKDWMTQPWANYPIISIGPDLITKWRDERVQAGAAPSTVSNHMNTLSHVFKIASSEWGLKIENPVRGIERPKARKARVAIPDDGLEAVLLEAANAGEHRWLAPLIEIAAWTAMRQGEIRALRWYDLDFDRHLITIPDSKNNHGRKVPMLDAVEEVFRAWAGNKDLRSTDWIFTSIKDSTVPLTLDNASTEFAKLMKAVVNAAPEDRKPKSITFHDLRHWGCTRLAPLHRDALDLSKTTGHLTINCLAKYFNPDEANRAAEIRERAAEAKLKKMVKAA